MKLQVDGMNCQRCVSHIREALETLDGARGITIDLANGTVEVDGVSLDAAINAIEEQGYQVVRT